MNNPKARKQRIFRQKVPAIEQTVTRLNQKIISTVEFFDTIHNTFSLLNADPLDTRHQAKAPQLIFERRFIVPVRIRELARHRRTNSICKHWSKDKPLSSYSKTHSLRRPLQSISLDSQIEVSPVISGTKIGALSTVEIMEKFERQNEEELFKKASRQKVEDSEGEDSIIEFSRLKPMAPKAAGTVKASRPGDIDSLYRVIMKDEDSERLIEMNAKYEKRLLKRVSEYHSKTLLSDYSSIS